MRGGEKVLEVGAGSGYHAAVLAALGARVVAVELIPELAEQARLNLEAAGRAAGVARDLRRRFAGVPGRSSV